MVLFLTEVHKDLFSNNYSYLRASIGFNLDARAAGATPKTIPIIAETPNESTTLHHETEV